MMMDKATVLEYLVRSYFKARDTFENANFVYHATGLRGAKKQAAYDKRDDAKARMERAEEVLREAVGLVEDTMGETPVTRLIAEAERRRTQSEDGK